MSISSSMPRPLACIRRARATAGCTSPSQVPERDCRYTGRAARDWPSSQPRVAASTVPSMPIRPIQMYCGAWACRRSSSARTFGAETAPLISGDRASMRMSRTLARSWSSIAWASTVARYSRRNRVRRASSSTASQRARPSRISVTSSTDAAGSSA